MTTSEVEAFDVSGAVPPPPRADVEPGPPVTGVAALASVQAQQSPITHLRYVALGTENVAQTVAFYEGIWGLYRVAGDAKVVYLGAVGSPEPFIIRIREASQPCTDVIAFGAKDPAAVDQLAATLGSDGVRLVDEPGLLRSPGGGYGFRFFDPDGRVVEVSADVAAKPYRDLEPRESIPRRLSHVVINTSDVPALKAFYERYFGMRLSDWLANVMCFLRCSTDHHSLAIAQGAPGLNHISFEMRDIDEYMRGTGRMVRGGHDPLWGPGRHSAGDNVYSYFAGPDRFVVEYTTALEQVCDEDAWVPRVWAPTPDHADRWGTAGPGTDLFALLHHSPADPVLWTAAPI